MVELKNLKDFVVGFEIFDSAFSWLSNFKIEFIKNDFPTPEGPTNNIFKCFGIDYIYEENGNNIESLINILNKIKDNKKPIVLHIHTLKGNGYEYAYLNKEKYHYALPFDVKNGEFKNDSSRMEYGEISYQFLSSLMDKDKNVVVLTSAVAYLCNFNKERREKYKDQFIDVGIAEAFGVSFLSGLGKGNTKVYYPVTCSFLQRGYDSLIEDFALNEIDSTILLCFGSLYSSKDVTHIGIFDEIMLSNIPNLIYLDPTSYEEYISMLEYSYEYKHGPLVIRVPNKIRYDNKKDDTDYSMLNKSKIINEGKDIAIFYVGNLEFLAEEIKDEFLKQGKNITLIRQRFLSGIDKELINRLISNHKVIITLEDTILDAGFGNKISSYLGNKDIYVLNYGLKKEFIDRYDINQLLKDNHLNKDSIILDINKIIK